LPLEDASEKFEEEGDLGSGSERASQIDTRQSKARQSIFDKAGSSLKNRGSERDS